MRQITEGVKNLLIINALFYLGTILFKDQFYEWFALYFPPNENFKFWQVLTHMFMHGGLMHIFFNMYALYAFGMTLEAHWGTKKFLFFYLSCGLGAMLIHTGVNFFEYYQGLNAIVSKGVPTEEAQNMIAEGMVFKDSSLNVGLESAYQAYHGVAVGASGALYGVLVAFAFLYPNSELMLLFIPFPIKAKYFVPGLVAIDLFLGLSGGVALFGSGGIAHFAHVGGALTGYLIMKYWQGTQFQRWDR